jgi:uncharacterized surface protein with fasciclin (FAS1) repeats
VQATVPGDTPDTKNIHHRRSLQMKRFRNACLAVAGAVVLGLTSTAATARSPVPGKPAEQDIVSFALGVNAASGEFDLLLGAATCPYFDGAVVRLLQGDAKLTLFAPTDRAFRALLGRAQPAAGAPEPRNEKFPCEAFAAADLFNVLAYHVADGRRFSNSVFNRNGQKMLEMLNGQYVVTNPDVTLTDNQGRSIGIVAPLFDLNASNGVVHVIDAVLLP